MPFLISERPDGDNLGIDRGQVDYVVRATTAGETIENARATLAAIAPISKGTNLVRRDIQLHSENDAALFPGLWSATVMYAPIVVPVAGDAIEWSGSVGGASKKIKKFLKVKHTVPLVPFAPCDFDGAINVTSKGEVEGLDVISGNATLNATMKFPNTSVTLAYFAILADLADGRTNDAFFLGFAPGELLFLGADFHQLDQTYSRFTFKFSARPNRTNVVIDEFTIPSIGGHEYVWFYFLDEEYTADKIVAPRAIIANSGRVYQPAPYPQLGFGP